MSDLRKKWPRLFSYLEAYGLDKNIIDKIDRIKGNAYSAYHVVGWKAKDGRIHLLDLSQTEDHAFNPGFGWNMLNDGMEPPITEADWRKLKVDDYCETFFIEGHPEFG